MVYLIRNPQRFARYVDMNGGLTIIPGKGCIHADLGAAEAAKFTKQGFLLGPANLAEEPAVVAETVLDANDLGAVSAAKSKAKSKPTPSLFDSDKPVGQENR